MVPRYHSKKYMYLHTNTHTRTHGVIFKNNKSLDGRGLDQGYLGHIQILMPILFQFINFYSTWCSHIDKPIRNMNFFYKVHVFALYFQSDISVTKDGFNKRLIFSSPYGWINVAPAITRHISSLPGCFLLEVGLRPITRHDLNVKYLSLPLESLFSLGYIPIVILFVVSFILSIFIHKCFWVLTLLFCMIMF